MPTQIVVLNIGKGPPKQQNRNELHAIATMKEPLPHHIASNPKAGGPPTQRPDRDVPAQVDRPVEQMAVSTLEETMPTPEIQISKTIVYSNNVLALAKKLAQQILKLLNFLTYEPFVINSDEIIKWQSLFDKVQDMPKEESKEELKSSEPRTEQRQQYTSLSHPLEKFTCFGYLPLEMRLLIWKFARPDPRVVRLAWSKWPGKPPRHTQFPECWRANYSEAPIPAMLHACAESRKIALGWYRLALENGVAGPRVYFDFSSDFLQIGCNDCHGQGHCNLRCMDILNQEQARCVQKVLLSCPGYRDPALILYWSFRFVKEILLYDSATGPLITKTKLSHLKQTIQPFDWQRGKDLHTYLLEKKAFWKSFGELEQKKGRKNYYDEIHCFKPEKLARVELAITPETSKIYGFMEKQFTGNEFLTPNGMVNSNSNSRHTRKRRVGGRKPASSRQLLKFDRGLRNHDNTSYAFKPFLVNQSNETRLGSTTAT